MKALCKKGSESSQSLSFYSGGLFFISLLNTVHSLHAVELVGKFPTCISCLFYFPSFFPCHNVSSVMLVKFTQSYEVILMSICARGIKLSLNINKPSRIDSNNLFVASNRFTSRTFRSKIETILLQLLCSCKSYDGRMFLNYCHVCLVCKSCIIVFIYLIFCLSISLSLSLSLVRPSRIREKNYAALVRGRSGTYYNEKKKKSIFTLD